MGLAVGDTVPDFSLNDQEGNLFDIKDVLGKKALVIYFYPKDQTPGCIKEACSFRDRYEDFIAHGAEVIGISSDSEASHQKFAKRYKLPFVLLADKNKKVRRLFKVEANLLGLLPGRETYVIDKEGKIAMVFNSMNAAKHIPMALQMIEKIAK